MEKVFSEGIEYRAFGTHHGLFISDQGRIISFRRGGPQPSDLMHRNARVVVGSIDPDGYPHITRPKRFIHEIVLTTWGTPRPDGLQCRHLNGVKSDNRICNLVWGTAKENGEDKAKHGTTKGEGNHRAKLTVERVLELRRLYIDVPLSELVRRFPEFSKFALWAAVSGYTWTHLPGAIPGRRRCSKDGWRQGVRVR